MSEVVSVFRRICKICQKWLLASTCLYVCPPVRMEKRGSNWTDIRDILCLVIFRIYVSYIQISLHFMVNNFLPQIVPFKR
jgi:hypothetical protein